MCVFVERLEHLITRRGLYRVWEPTRKGQPTPLVARWIDPERETRDLQENQEAIAGEDPEHVWALLIRTRRHRGAEWGACNLPVMSPLNTDPFSHCFASGVVEVRLDAPWSLPHGVGSGQARRPLLATSDSGPKHDRVLLSTWCRIACGFSQRASRLSQCAGQLSKFGRVLSRCGRSIESCSGK